jgi:thiaminase (transcriptional activator TenA)
MLRTTLQTRRQPTLDRVLNHPFWRGLADGSTPASAMKSFIEQDTTFLLPCYARALARCAAASYDDAAAMLLGQSVVGTLQARDRLQRSALTVPALGALAQSPPLFGPTRAYTSLLTAATAHSYWAGLGALLPMVWFNHDVANSLVERVRPESPYGKWIAGYHPGPTYGQVVDAFLGLVDQAVADGSERDRRVLIDHFSMAIDYEWNFAESCLRGQ